jgi:hypothetical protein
LRASELLAEASAEMRALFVAARELTACSLGWNVAATRSDTSWVVLIPDPIPRLLAISTGIARSLFRG